jgi:hypothetical protein
LPRCAYAQTVGSWPGYAETLRAAVDAATLSAPLKRSVVAPGPDFARDCRMVAVVLTRPQTVPLQREFAGGVCYAVPQLTFDVVFVADCVPVPGSDGSPPSPAAVTAWSVAFLGDVQSIYTALVTAALSGDLGDCDSVTIGEGTPTGPTGQIATMRFPVTVLDTI